MAAIVLSSCCRRLRGLKPYGDMQWLEQLLRLASRIAVNRTIAGVHFPVDSAAGAVIGPHARRLLRGALRGPEPEVRRL